MIYPEYAEIRGKKYKIDTNYKTALKCFQIVNDDSLGDYERAYAVVYILFDFIPEDELMNEFLSIATKFLQCGKTAEEHKSREKDLDFDYDQKYIVASFMSDYHIDLNNTELHWWQFIDLISGLTENCILSKVREIRNYDISTIKDASQRSKILKAKEEVALPIKLTQEEKKELEEFNKLFE